ncbi:MAG TPA: hypothetical protein VK524_00890 [Polyangiaceae bacterium]|nr:hypothetical protein [Polyangiaceae bacterium]
MAEYINWLKAPAVLRGVAAHADASGAAFAKSNTWLVDTMIGGRPWFWKLLSDTQGYYLEPTLGERGSADFYLYRTLCGVGQALRGGAPWYFNVDAADPNLNPSGTTDWANRRTRTLQRKRAYYWGLLGDATLLIRYP